MASHSSILGWKIPWTEEPGIQGVAKSQTTEHMMDGWTDGPNMGSHAHTLEGGMVGPRTLRMPSMAPMWLWGSLWNTELTTALFPEGECPRTSCPLWNWINLSRSTSTQQLSKRIIYNKKNPKPWNTKPMSITKYKSFFLDFSACKILGLPSSSERDLSYPLLLMVLGSWSP